jgi:hypothetical protein
MGLAFEASFAPRILTQTLNYFVGFAFRPCLLACLFSRFFSFLQKSPRKKSVGPTLNNPPCALPVWNPTTTTTRTFDLYFHILTGILGRVSPKKIDSSRDINLKRIISRQNNINTQQHN